MARARLIKPGFFDNEDLASLPFSARLLFIGLWCIADKKGRLEDRPKRIERDVFPYDRHVKAAPLLDGLSEKGFILRYEVEGRALIWIPTFLAHQRPHPNEAKSTLPAHPQDIGEPSDNQGDPMSDQGTAMSGGIGSPPSLIPDRVSSELKPIAVAPRGRGGAGRLPPRDVSGDGENKKAVIERFEALMARSGG